MAAGAILRSEKVNCSMVASKLMESHSTGNIEKKKKKNPPKFYVFDVNA